jgi:osmotically-inducible protein OsmY
VVDDSVTSHDTVTVNSPRVAADSHAAAKVDPTPIAPVPSATALNEREHADGTPADRHSSASDAEITQRIRKAVVNDDNLTATAKNVKIATEDGRVTLRGDVHDAHEKDTVESHARDVVGAGNVRSQIAVVN